MHYVCVTSRVALTKVCHLIRREEKIIYENIFLVRQMNERIALVNPGLTEPKYLRRFGLSKAVYYMKRWQACRALYRHMIWISLQGHSGLFQGHAIYRLAEDPFLN